MSSESLADLLDERIQSLPQVDKRKSKWSSNDAYSIKGREFVHFHGSNKIDIRLTKKLQKKFADMIKGDARVESRIRPSEWVMLTLLKTNDVEFAYHLIRLAHMANLDR